MKQVLQGAIGARYGELVFKPAVAPQFPFIIIYTLLYTSLQRRYMVGRSVGLSSDFFKDIEVKLPCSYHLTRKVAPK